MKYKEIERKWSFDDIVPSKLENSGSCIVDALFS